MIVYYRVMSLSTLSEQEYIALLSTLKSMYDKKFSCHTCINQFDGRRDAEIMHERIRTAMACTEESTNPRHSIEYANINISYKRCIGNFTNGAAASWVGFHTSYAAGALPFEGGLLDQPAKAIEILQTIGNYKSQQEAKAMEEQRMKMKSKSGALRGRK